MRQAEGPYALYALATVAFIESSIFPIPPDVLMIPMIIAKPHRAWLIALVATVASVLGGIAGYFIGWGAFESVALPILEFYGKAEKYDEFLQVWFAEYGIWAVLIAGVTPFPYKVITIAAGAAKMNMLVFILSSILARGLRFFIIAGLLWKFGAPIRKFIEERFGLVATIFFVLVIAGVAAVKFLF